MPAAQPRRLPTRVYWFRRGLVLVPALALVVGVVWMLGGGQDPAPTAEQATTAAQRSEPTPTALPVLGPLEPAQVRKRQVRQAAPAEPTGACAPEDVSAVPSVPSPAEVAGEEPSSEDAAQPAEAGRPVTIDIALQGTQPACTFEVGPQSIAVKVTTEDDAPFWSSQTCPGQVPRETVVVRSAEPTVVSMQWSARDSQQGCGGQAVWALPGFFRVHATVQGSTPSDVPFELVRPGVVYVTETPKPRKQDRDRGDEQEPAESAPDASPAPTPDPQPSASPQG